jgi:RNA polymerase sigma-70 factor (ECF subfamily)
MPPADREIVDAVLAGDSEAFRTLVDRESGPVIILCRRITGDQDEAEDAAQEAFIRAYRALPTFRGDGSFGAWIGRIARRVALARLATRRDTTRIDTAEADPWPLEGGGTHDPEARTLARERRDAIVAGIWALPDAYRDVLALRFLGDMTVEEIAQVTSTPLGTVKSRLHRATAALRVEMTSETAS